MTSRVLLLVAATAFTAPALAGTPVAFERDGISYVADVSDDHGVQVIEGHEVKSGRAFSLRVRDRQVSGNYDGVPVAYSAPKAAFIRTASR